MLENKLFPKKVLFISEVWQEIESLSSPSLADRIEVATGRRLGNGPFRTDLIRLLENNCQRINYVKAAALGRRFALYES